jgi:hypothetical protein
MIFLVLHEQGAMNYQEKREAERSTPRNNNNYGPGAKRRLDMEEGSPKKQAK